MLEATNVAVSEDMARRSGLLRLEVALRGRAADLLAGERGRLEDRLAPERGRLVRSSLGEDRLDARGRAVRGGERAVERRDEPSLDEAFDEVDDVAAGLCGLHLELTADARDERVEVRSSVRGFPDDRRHGV